MNKEEAFKELRKIPLSETSRQFCEWMIDDFTGILKYTDRIKLAKALSITEKDKVLQFTDNRT